MCGDLLSRWCHSSPTLRAKVLAIGADTVEPLRLDSDRLTTLVSLFQVPPVLPSGYLSPRKQPMARESVHRHVDWKF